MPLADAEPLLPGAWCHQEGHYASGGSHIFLFGSRNPREAANVHLLTSGDPPNEVVIHVGRREQREIPRDSC